MPIVAKKPFFMARKPESIRPIGQLMKSAARDYLGANAGHVELAMARVSLFGQKQSVLTTLGLCLTEEQARTKPIHHYIYINKGDGFVYEPILSVQKVV